MHAVPAEGTFVDQHEEALKLVIVEDWRRQGKLEDIALCVQI
jgi:hypothetical protein